MDSTFAHQNTQSTKKIITYNILKKITKFLLSYYVLLTFFSNRSWLSFSLEFFISHIPKFLSHVDDKNCIFLVCNVLVVILAKSSKRLSTSSEPTPAAQILPEKPPQGTLLYDENSSMALQLVEIPYGAYKSDELIANVVVEKNGSFAKDIEEENKSNIRIGEDEAEVSGDEDEDEEEDEEGSIARMSTEDLNKRFEDFIRRMKEDIRIEAQQQLIVV